MKEEKNIRINHGYVLNRKTFKEPNLPDPRICTRISTIFPIFSGVSLQKRGSPLIACTRTWEETEKHQTVETNLSTYRIH